MFVNMLHLATKTSGNEGLGMPPISGSNDCSGAATFLTFGRALAAIVLAFVNLSAMVPARAAWPERTVTIIAHFAPGGANDLLARLIAAELTPILGQSVVVVNHPGANGNIGVEAATHAAPDGYTLLVASGSALVNPSLHKVPYDLERDFVPVAYLGASPNVILTNAGSGIESIEDLIAKAKRQPGTYNFGTAGVGSTPHMAMELLMASAGIKLVHVPFSGLGPAVNAMLQGTTDLAAVTVAGVMGHINGGTARALLQTGKEPWPELPDVPTIEKAGIKDADSETVQIVLAPAGTPEPILSRLESEIVSIMQREDVRARMLKAGFQAAPKGRAYLRERLHAELALWRRAAERAGLAEK
jgi:tripartite-type tricarboxylate transporter receptor subunit TctC